MSRFDMKQSPEYFEGREPELIYIAKSLKDAIRLESILTAEGSIMESKPTSIRAESSSAALAPARSSTFYPKPPRQPEQSCEPTAMSPP